MLYKQVLQRAFANFTPSARLYTHNEYNPNYIDEIELSHAVVSVSIVILVMCQIMFILTSPTGLKIWTLTYQHGHIAALYFRLVFHSHKSNRLLKDLIGSNCRFPFV